MQTLIRSVVLSIVKIWEASPLGSGWPARGGPGSDTVSF